METTKEKLAAYIAELKERENEASNTMYEMAANGEQETTGGAMWTERALQLRDIINELTGLLTESK